MSNSVSLTGEDVIQIDSRIVGDLADGDAGKITPPNDLATVKTSKNGNTIYALNNSGLQMDVELRVLLGSSDDQFLNSRMQEMKQDFSKFTLLSGFFCKRVGDGKGGVKTVVYQCNGGVFKKQVEAKTSAEGDVDQSVAVYTIAFGNGSRSVQ